MPHFFSPLPHLTGERKYEKQKKELIRVSPTY
jgi:hypothetical protein